MKMLRDKTTWDGKEKRSADRIKRLRMKNIKGRIRISNLRKRLLIYFILVIFVSFSVGIELIHEVGEKQLRDKIQNSITSQISDTVKSNLDMSGVDHILSRLQKRMMVIMLIVFICVVATMLVFIRNIVEPLDEMGRATKKMAKGHLEEMVPIRTKDEIGQIGELINDLAINLQEILLRVWNHTGQDIVLLDRIAQIISSDKGNGVPEEIKNSLRFVRDDIIDLQDMVKTFDFYQVKIEEERIFMNNVGIQDEANA